MKAFVQLVCDYGIGDPAFGEVTQRLMSLEPELSVYPTSVPAFSTLATGYWIAQYAIHKHPPKYIIYSNTAPRHDAKQERKGNEGEKFAYAKLKNGVEIAAVNAEYCFSFVKHLIEDFRVVNIPNKGSQFRSRDFYPESVVGLLNDEYEKYIGEKLEIENIPDIPKYKLAFVDGYGNLKTTIRQTEINYPAGQKVKVILNGVIRMAIYANGNFEVKEGELAFAPGSGGEEGNKYLEIFLRGGSAYEYFDRPHVNKSITLSEVS